jgi:hypothetical protein
MSTQPKSPESVPAARALLSQKTFVLQELQTLAQDQKSRSQTVLGRWFECQELQIASALLAKAVEQCSRWRAGKRLHPPEGSLPPTN